MHRTFSVSAVTMCALCVSNSVVALSQGGWPRAVSLALDGAFQRTSYTRSIGRSLSSTATEKAAGGLPFGKVRYE